MLRKSITCNPGHSQSRRISAALAVLLFAGCLLLPVGASEPILGYVEEVIPLEVPCVDESDTGNAVADAWREVLDTDAALVPGGILGGPIPAGGQTEENLRSVFLWDESLAVAEVTETQLQALLEVGVSRIELNEKELIDREVSGFDGFLQVSGFTFRYDASAPVGERVDEIVLDSGLSLLEDGEETRLTVTLPMSMARGEWGFPVLTDAKEQELTALGALCRRLERGNLTPPEDGRIRIRGSSEQSIFSEYLPLWVVVPAMVILAVPGFWIRRREREEEF